MRKTAIFASLVVLALSDSAFSQTVQEAKDQAEIEKAKAEAAASKAAAKKSELELQQAEEKAKLELQQAEEKAKLELQAAQDNADDAQRKALTESIGLVNNLKTDTKDASITGSAIETKVLANRAVSKALVQVVAMVSPVVCGSTATTVILADDQATGTLPGYEAGMLTLRTLAKSYTALIRNTQNSFEELKNTHDRQEKALLTALPALLQGVAAVGSIAQTFKTQLNIAGEDINIDQLAVYGALAEAWATKCATSTLTAYQNLGVDFSNSEAANQLDVIIDLLATAQDLESEIAIWLIPNKAASAKDLAVIGAAKKTAANPRAPKQPPPTEAQKAAAEARKSAITQIEAVLAKLKADNLRVDQAIQQLFAASEKQPVSPIVQMAKAERFATAVKSANAYVLTIKAVAGGGNTITTNNFWRGAKVFHSGGAVLAYTLLKGNNGAYVGGGLLDSHQGYVQLEVANKNSLGNSWDLKPSEP